MESLADALRLLPTDRTEGLRRLEEALSDFPKTGDEEGVIPPLASLANALMLQGQADAAKKVADRALTLAARESNAPGRLLATAVVYSAIGEYAEAVARLREAENLASQASDVSTLAQVLVSLEYVLSMDGQWEDAARAHAKLLELTSTLDEAAAQILAFTSGQAHLARREFIFAAEHFEQLLAIYRRRQDVRGSGEAHALLGFAYGAAHDLPRAEENYREALRISRELQDMKWQVAILLDYSEVFRTTGRASQAVAILEEARRLGERLGDRVLVASADLSLGVALADSGEPTRAVYHVENAVQVSRTLGLPALEARALAQLSRLRASQGEAEKTLQSYREAVRAAEAAGDSQALLEVHLIGGEALTAAGHTQIGMNSLQRARELARQQGNYPSEASALDALASAFQNEGKLEEALESNRQALKLREYLQDLPQQAFTLAEMASLYEALGRPDEALALQTRALRLTREANAPILEALLLGGIADTYMRLGDRALGLEYLKEAETIARSSGDRSARISALAALGLGYFFSGDLRRALAAAQEAIDLAESPQEQAQTAGAIMILIAANAQLGQDEEVVNALRTCKQYFAQRWKAEWTGCWASFASVLTQRLYQSKPSPILERGAQDFLPPPSNEASPSEPTPFAPLQLFAQLQLAVVDLLRGERATAQEKALAVRAHVSTVESRQWGPALHTQVGFVLLKLGLLQEAREELAQGIELYEQTWAALPGDELRARFLGEAQLAYDLMFLALLGLEGKNPGQGYDREAIFYHDRAQARSLRERLSDSRMLSRRDPGLSARLEALRAGVEALRVKRAGASTEEGQRLDLEITEHLQAMDRLREGVRVLERQAPPTTLSATDFIAALQNQLLDENTALLTFRLGERVSFACAITQAKVTCAPAPPQAKVEGAAQQLLFFLHQPDLAPVVAEYTAVAGGLYSDLVAPLVPALRNKAHLVIVPDGLLGTIPFEALIVPSELPEPGTSLAVQALPFLIRRYSISYGPSASTLLQLASRPARRETWAKDLVVFADPVVTGEQGASTEQPTRTLPAGLPRLQHAGAEAARIAALFPPARTEVHLRATATKDEVKAPDHLAPFRIIHFATHGVLEERRPAFSGLVLSPSASHEVGLPDPLRLDVNRSSVASGTLLNLYEILDLDVNAELVVLSACETARGPMVRGEGALSLSRAFLYAGAQSVLASLWRVDDASTAELMAAFYRSFVLEGTPKAEALRKAKLALMADGRFASPYYWAPFVLVGR